MRTKKENGGGTFEVGSNILIRTVTMYQVGRIRSVDADWIVLDDASWIADMGRFSTALESGELAEVERCPSWIAVARGSIVDVVPWTHDLPKKSK